MCNAASELSSVMSSVSGHTVNLYESAISNSASASALQSGVSSGTNSPEHHLQANQHSALPLHHIPHQTPFLDSSAANSTSFCSNPPPPPPQQQQQQNNNDSYSSEIRSNSTNSDGATERTATKYEPASPSPATTGIVSDNGLQYANLDGSCYGNSTSSAHNAASNYGQSCGSNSSGYSQAHIYEQESNSTAAAAFSAYLEGGSYAAAMAAAGGMPSHGGQGVYPSQHHPGLYPSHHTPKIGGAMCRDYIAAATANATVPNTNAYPSHQVPRSTSSVPTYKWMQVKRNVPKPGNGNYTP